MKISRVVWVIAGSLCCCAATSAQSQAVFRPVSARAASGLTRVSAFEPLDRWKTAVIAGDQAALSALYTTTPPSETQTPRGNSADPSEEPRFWSALAGSGLTDLQIKILSLEHLDGGVTTLVFRVSGKIKTNSGLQTFLVEMGQRWMQQGGSWQIFATQRSDLGANPVMRLPEPAIPNTSLYPPPDDAKAEIHTALAMARADHKRVILVFGANWCYDCHVLDATFRSKDIAPLVNANYHVVHINVGDDGDKNLDLAESYGVPLKQAVRIPSLAVLSPDGKVVYSQKNGEFDDSVKLAPSDVTGFLNKWKPQS